MKLSDYIMIAKGSVSRYHMNLSRFYKIIFILSHETIILFRDSERLSITSMCYKISLFHETTTLFRISERFL